MSEPITMAERYLTASNTSKLRLLETERTAADVLVAAGYVAQGNRDLDVALMLWGMREKKRRYEFDDAVDILTKRLYQRGTRKRERIGSHAKETIRRALWWWMEQPACVACHGRGHPVIPETPHLDTSRYCEVCDGHKIEPMHKVVRTEWMALAHDVLHDLQCLESEVGQAMMKKLRVDLDF